MSGLKCVVVGKRRSDAYLIIGLIGNNGNLEQIL
jgi:hypothetical protein